MDANTINQQAVNLSEYIFSGVFWINSCVAFLLGMLANYCSGRISDWQRKKKRGTLPYCESFTTGKSISVEAQVPNTAANLAVVSKLTKATVPENS